LAEIEDIQKTSELSDEFKKCESERIDICKKFSKKDENGDPIMSEGKFVIDNTKEFDIELNKLQEKYKNEIDKREKQIKDYKKLLDENSSVKFHEISLADIPKGIKSEHLDMIFELIED